MLDQLRSFARRYAPGTDVGLAFGMVVLLAVLVIPLPTVLLDMGLALSITASVLVLMVAMFLRRPLDFTSFPDIVAADHIVAAIAERCDDEAHPKSR